MIAIPGTFGGIGRMVTHASDMEQKPASCSPTIKAAAALYDQQNAAPMAKYAALVRDVAREVEVAPEDVLRICEAAGRTLEHLDIDAKRFSKWEVLRRQMDPAKIEAAKKAAEEASDKFNEAIEEHEAAKVKLQELQIQADAAGRHSTHLSYVANELKLAARDAERELAKDEFAIFEHLPAGE